MKATEEQLWQIVQASPVAMAVYGSGGNIYKVNDTFIDLFGYNLDDISHVEDWFPKAYPDEEYRDEIMEQWNSEIERSLKTGEKFVPIKATVTCKNGSRKDIEFNFSAIGDLYLTTFIELTSYNQILKKFQESEERYRALFEGSRDGIVMIDVNGNILDANGAYCFITGYSLEDLKNLNINDITPEKWHAWEWNQIIEGQLLKRGYSDTYEKEYIHKNGTVFPIELDTYRFENRETGEFFFWGVVRDISERKNAKVALRESEERFRKLSSLTFEGILIHKNAEYIDSNRAFLQMLGYEAEELKGVNLIEKLMAPGSRKYVMERISEEHAMPYEAEMVHKSGRIFPVEVEARNITWEGERIRVAAFRNIFQRKQTEKIAGARLAILEYSYDCTLQELLVKTLDEAEELTASSIGFFHFLETNQKKISLQVWSINTTGNMCRAEGNMHYDIDEAGVWTDCVFSGKPVIHNDYENLPHRKRLPEGHAPLVRELTVPIIRNNLIVAIIGVGNKLSPYDENDITIITRLADLAWDIAVQKKTEAALNQEIEEKEKIQDHLLQAQKMEAIGTLAGGIAHDFNNILGGMMGSIEILGNMLRKENLANDEKIEKYLSILQKASIRGSDIVKQLLTLSRKQESRLSVMKLNDALWSIYEIVSNSFPKSVEMKFNIPEKNIYIEADETQINQAILNLCVNASQAMTVMRGEGEKEGGVLTVELDGVGRNDVSEIVRREMPDAGNFVRVTVSDTGVGMDEETKDQIFDPFYTTKNKEEGTGLGLAMVYGIVNKHNGHIHLYSEKGRGSVFTFYLPEYNMGGSQPRHGGSEQEASTGSGKILIIDDEEDILAVVEEMLLQRGFSVVTAVGAENGITIYKNHDKEFDAVILDLSMPEKSGLEAFRELQEVDPAIKVLMSSGFEMDERIRKAIDLGARGFIHKPYRIHEIVTRLNEILKG